MKKLIRRVIILLALLVILAGIIVVVKPEIFQITTNKTAETSLVQEKLVELSELTTLKYIYSNVIISRTEKSLSVLGTDFNYAEAIKLIEYSGYLKAGTDLSQVQMSYDEAAKKLFVRVPKAQILDNVVETEKTKVEDVKGNIFSDYPTQTVFDEINADKKQLAAEKIEQGFLAEADQRIELLLTSFLSSNGFNDVVVEFI